MPLNRTEKPNPVHEVFDHSLELLGRIGNFATYVTYVALDVIPAKIDAAAERVLHSERKDADDR